MTPDTRLFLAELRAARPSALRRLRAALRAHRGNVTEAAAELGVGVRSLYDARASSPGVQAVFAELAQGREGSRRAAAAAKRAKSLASQKRSKKAT